ncbi:VC0807 family protein [Kitasatospora sp. NPDC096147]|uniref:VC0807 family protein n=1 Tax=Kitasatospora sp. NPDC096147 TaxID=3364093 RepID=UPI00380EC013
MAVIESTTVRRQQRDGSPWAGLKPLAVDVAVPLAAYYLAHGAFGLGLVASLTVASAVPVVRTVGGLLRDRRVNALAAVMLVVNLAGIGLSLLAGDARLMLLKDAALSSVIGGSMIVTALLGRPLMTAGMKPFVVKGRAAREAAWQRLAAGSAAFRRDERSFSLAWGGVLVAECAAKAVGAYVLPVETMVWLGTVMLVAAIGLGIVLGNVFAGRIAERVIAEAGEAA